jgi:hypothetical protein
MHFYLLDPNFSHSLPNGYTISGLESLSSVGDITTKRNGDVLTISGTLQMRYIKGTGKLSDHDRREAGFNAWKATIPHVRLKIALDLNCKTRGIDIIEYYYEKFSNAAINIELNEHWDQGNYKTTVVNDLAEDAFESVLKPIIQKDVMETLKKKFSKFHETDFLSELFGDIDFEL